MLIGIDGNEANVSRRVGIGEYAYQLLCGFYKLRKGIEFRIYLKDSPLEDMPRQTTWWKYEIVKPRKYWTQFGLPLRLFLAREKPDIFFSPSHYSPRFAPMPRVISIMDLAYVRFPELFAKRDLYQLKNWTKYSAEHASKIFTISESSKNDIIQEYNVRSENVVVTYLGIKPIMNKSSILRASQSNLREKYHISDKYILFVGTIQPRKNIFRLIEAFAKICNSKNGFQKDLNLVIVGKKGWLYEDILTAPERFGVKDLVKFLDFVPDEDLPGLYENSLFYILPSLYEGFGLPVLEAMKYGCPVITSNVSSLPEAGGDAALYVDPQDVNDIAEKMEKLLKDKNLRERMREKGFKQIKKFSWEKTAKETLDVLTEVTQNSSKR